MENLRRYLEDRKHAGLYRTRRLCEGDAPVRCVVSGRPVVAFCSNDYLGLAAHPELIRALRDGADRYGVGSTAATLVSGYTTAHQQLEEKLAALTGRDRALLFSTGYMANLGAVAALAPHCGGIFEDRLNHASLLDAAQLARSRFRRYRHRDYDSLDAMLAGTTNALVVSDAVFSMDGDIAGLERLVEICTKRKAILMVDDAHGFGVHGTHGAGTVRWKGLTQAQVPVLVGTFGKAVGTFGAFVAGDEVLIETLIQTARTYIYTTAPPPALACATLESLNLIEREPERRAKLQCNIDLFKRLSTAAGLPKTHSDTAIQPLVVGAAQTAVAVSERLFADGIQVVAIRPPTVPEGSARLRITLSSQHEAADIERLVERLTEAYSHGVPALACSAAQGSVRQRR